MSKANDDPRRLYMKLGTHPALYVRPFGRLRRPPQVNDQIMIWSPEGYTYNGRVMNVLVCEIKDMGENHPPLYYVALV